MAIPLGVTLTAVADPTGNNQDAAEIVRVKDDGTVLHSGLFVYLHANQLVRGYFGSPSPSNSAGEVFEIASVPQTLTLAPGQLVAGTE